MAELTEKLLVEPWDRANRLHDHQRSVIGSLVSAALDNPAVDHPPNRVKANGDLNLAIRYSDRFLLLKDSGVYASGGAECMTPENIEAVYSMHVHIIEHRGIPVVVPFPDVH